MDGAEVTFKHITLERLGTRVIELVNGAQLHVGALGFASMGASIVYRIGAGCALTFDASQWDPEVVANTTFDFASQGSGSLKYFPSSIRNGSTVPTSPAIPTATCSKSPARAAPSASRCATAASSPTGRADDSARRVTRSSRPRGGACTPASPRRRKRGPGTDRYAANAGDTPFLAPSGIRMHAFSACSLSPVRPPSPARSSFPVVSTPAPDSVGRPRLRDKGASNR